MSRFAFGIAGSIDPELGNKLGVATEEAGFDAFWANDTATGDGLKVLSGVAPLTERIDLGVGVIPVDRSPAATIADKIARYELPVERLVVGVGSGGLRKGTVEAVEQAIDELRELGAIRISVGALGPRMLDLAGRKADGVLLNWLTPKAAADSAAIVREAAAKAERPAPAIVAYVRTGLSSAADRLAVEGKRYAGIPAYGAHFARMGVDPFETTAHGTPESIQATLGAFAEVVDEVVVRAIVIEETLDEYLALLEASKPA
jgi:alkanesulfonate monooxygenase SsuD/methylene tetrahydromethanopterin reductase-like flavin-dependent oxidoreductase (luciferase family)